MAEFHPITQANAAQSLRHENAEYLFHQELTLERALCGPAATASVINYLRNAPLITSETDGHGISIGKLITILRLFDSTYIEDDNEEAYEWRGVTGDGMSYYSGLRTLLSGFGIASETKINFGDIEAFDEFLAPRNGDKQALVISVASSFSSEVTRKLQGDNPVDLAQSGHLIAVFGKSSESGLYTVFDPFGNGQPIAVDGATLNTHIANHPFHYQQAIAASTNPASLSLLNGIPSHFSPVNPVAEQTIKNL